MKDTNLRDDKLEFSMILVIEGLKPPTTKAKKSEMSPSRCELRIRRIYTINLLGSVELHH